MSHLLRHCDDEQSGLLWCTSECDLTGQQKVPPVWDLGQQLGGQRGAQVVPVPVYHGLVARAQVLDSDVPGFKSQLCPQLGLSAQ